SGRFSTVAGWLARPEMWRLWQARSGGCWTTRTKRPNWAAGRGSAVSLGIAGMRCRQRCNWWWMMQPRNVGSGLDNPRQTSNIKRTGPHRVLIVSPMNVGSLGFFCRRAFERLGYTVEVFDYRREALGENYDRTVRAGLARILRNKVRVALMNRRLGKVVEREAPDL